jgi:hypothetical protein
MYSIMLVIFVILNYVTRIYYVPEKQERYVEILLDTVRIIQMSTCVMLNVDKDLNISFVVYRNKDVLYSHKF